MLDAPRAARVSVVANRLGTHDQLRKGAHVVAQNVEAGLTRAAMFLVLTVRADADLERVRAWLAEAPTLTRALDFRVADDHLDCVVGIGAHLWNRLYDLPGPTGLHPFEPVVGATHTAPATPGDLLLHVRAEQIGTCFELSRRLVDALDGLADVVDEVHGFGYFDRRDLLGFVDGTENPVGDDAVAATRIGDDDPAYAGGSYVIVQKYVHDLVTWNALTIEQQEDAIGRTKLDDIELADDVKPSNSHVALTTIVEPDGTEREIVRANMPFGDVGSGEYGTYFIGYAADPDVIETMLRNMFIGKPEGNHDRILDVSTAVTGSLFFVPTVAFLEDPASAVADALGAVDAPAREPAAALDAVTASGTPDGSLGIGSLRGR